MTRSLMSRDPFGEMRDMVENLDRAFDSFLGTRSTGGVNATTIPIDVYEKGGNMCITAAVPGVKPEDLEVTTDENVLTIRGDLRQGWSQDENTKVYWREHRCGSFSRSVRLPDNLHLEKAEADFENGFVTIRIPKMEQKREKVRTIPIKGVHPRQQIEQDAE
jgi:HSP20 family protein